MSSIIFIIVGAVLCAGAAAFFVAAYPEATVSDVRESLAFRDRFIDFAIEAQGLDARALYDAFHSAFPTGDGTR